MKPTRNISISCESLGRRTCLSLRQYPAAPSRSVPPRSGSLAEFRWFVSANAHGLPAEELERRLIELGFVEGARVELLHEGLFGRDPIAVRVNEATVALRRWGAASILVEPDR
jgi:Fe2+ transport system protein FeoA